MPNQHNQSAKISVSTRVLFAAFAILVMFLVVWFIKYMISTTSTDNTEYEAQLLTTSAPIPRSSAVPSTENAEDLDYTPDVLTTGVEDLPRSLQGTEVDGELIIDAQSGLVVTRGLRRLFDYFLSALGEENGATINARVEAYIRSRTPEPASTDAIALYYQYLHYLQQVAQIEDEYGTLSSVVLARGNKQVGTIDLTMMEKQQQKIQALRSLLFNQHINRAFFYEDDALYRYNVTMLKIAQDKSLTQSQKRQAQHSYINKLPDSVMKDHVKQQSNIEQLLTLTEQMQQEGASKDELFAMRANLVGKQAAERLAKLDAQNADFDIRFEQYQQVRDKILASKTASQLQQQQIAQLQQKLFSETEQKRLTGYEQLKQ